MALTGSNEDMDWLPGLGKSSHGASNSFSAPRADLETAFNTQAVDDAVQSSIECEDCGKHFWSRAKAHSHAAMTAHVLRKPSTSPLFPRSPATISAFAPQMDTLFSEREREASSDPDTLFIKTEAVASSDPDLLDQDFSEGSGDIICVDCDRRFRSYESVNDHAKRAHRPDTSGLFSAQHIPRPTNTGTPRVHTPNATDSPSLNSSAATLEHQLVIFPHECFDRIFFIVTPSGNCKSPGFIMGLAEAQSAATFRNGVRRRLESQGEEVGLREIVARVPVSCFPSPSFPKLYLDLSRKICCRSTMTPAPLFRLNFRSRKGSFLTGELIVALSSCICG